MIDLWYQYTSHWSDVVWTVTFLFSWLVVNEFKSSARRKENNNSFYAIFTNMSCYKVILKKTSIRKMWMMQHFSYKNAKWVLNHFSSPPSILCWWKSLHCGQKNLKTISVPNFSSHNSYGSNVELKANILIILM